MCGRGSSKIFVCACSCRISKLYLFTGFWHILPPIINILYLPKLGVFKHISPKIHPIYAIWICNENPSIDIPKFLKKNKTKKNQKTALQKPMSTRPSFKHFKWEFLYPPCFSEYLIPDPLRVLTLHCRVAFVIRVCYAILL